MTIQMRQSANEKKPEAIVRSIGYIATIVQIILTLAALFLIVIFINSYVGGKTDSFSVDLPGPDIVGTIDKLGQTYDIAIVSVGFPIPKKYEICFPIVIFTSLFFSLWMLERLKRFTERLFFDPFALKNAGDLRWISNALVILLLMNTAYTLVAQRFIPLSSISLPGVTHLRRSDSHVFYVWIIVALSLRLIALAFERGYFLREQERQLRQEAELTV